MNISKRIGTLSAALVFCTASVLQAQSLEVLTSELKNSVGTVETATKTFEPTIEVIQKGLLRYSYTEVDKKGGKTNFAFEFNLADIDPYAVREETQKDAIYSTLAVRNKQKLVKTYKNDEVQNYEDQVLIIAKDIESARALNELVKKAIPLAEKEMAAKLKLTSYEGMVKWLTENVKPVTLSTKTFTQTLAVGNQPGVMVLKVVEADAKGSMDETYTFNLADLNVHAITFKVVGNKIGINLETLQKAKYIATAKNNEVKPYTNSLYIHANNVDGARDLLNVFTMIIPLATEKVKGESKAPNTGKDAIGKMKMLVTDLTFGPKQLAQTMEGECSCTFTQTEKDVKATVVDAFKFNWMDVNGSASVIDVSGDKLFVELLTTDKQKVMMHTTKGNFDGYTNSFKIYFSSIEQARRFKNALETASERCKIEFKDPFSKDGAAAVKWLISKLPNATLEAVTLNQAIDLVNEGKYDKLKFTRKEVNSKGSGAEELYEFSLTDINPLSIRTEVQGKWLYVLAETDNKAKVIKYYKDGKIQPYVAKIEFAINDTELARDIVTALKTSSTDFKKNK